MTQEKEAANVPEEQVSPPPATEQEVTPPPEQEPPSETTSEFTKEKVAELISAAEGAVQSAKDKELTILKQQHRQDTRSLTAQHEEARLAEEEAREKEKFSEIEPDQLKAFQELRRNVRATEVSETQVYGFAYKLGKQYGVDPEVLLDSASPGEMETKAKELSQQVEKDAVKEKEDRIKQLENELAIAKKAPQKIDSSTTVATGGEMPDSAKGKMRAGWGELHK